MYIYKITAPDSRCYIGSTTIPIERRWSVHKSGFVRWTMGTAGYCTSYALFLDHDPEDCSIEILDIFPEGTPRADILAKERHHIQTYECVNKYCKPSTYDKAAAKRAYYAAHKEMYRQSYKDYYLLNAEKEKARQKAYYQKNRERLKAQALARYHTLKAQPAPETTSSDSTLH